MDVDYLNSEAYHKKAGVYAVPLCWQDHCWPGSKSLSSRRGDKIGAEGLTHLLGLQKAGRREFSYDDNSGFQTQHPQLKGCYMLLDEPSLTGTANILMAAVLAEGTRPFTTQPADLYPALPDAEPHGERTSGHQAATCSSFTGSVRWKEQNAACSDMIEVGSFIGMAAADAEWDHD